MQALRKAAFLDRDGVINVDRAYVSRLKDFEFVPGAVDAMRALKQAGFALVVVTNQSGIAVVTTPKRSTKHFPQK